MKTSIYEISDFIIKQVQENTWDCQYIIDKEKIEGKFNIKLNKLLNEKILDELFNREEVAAANLETDGFDIVLYTDYIK